MDIVKIVTEVFIPVVGAIVLYVVIPFLKAKTTLEQRNLATDIVKSLVLSAEQMEKTGIIDIPKKDYVLDQASKNEYIKKMGLSRKDLEIILEASVTELKSLK